jgi:hypothetical protein
MFLAVVSLPPQDELARLPCAHKGFWLRCHTLPIRALAAQAAAAGQRLVFTGHSLGGAVAAVAALEVLLANEEAGSGPEVLCVCFAAPIWCNATLARLIDGCAWGASFINVTVPEDYCLKLFNNVLTSADKPALAAAAYHRSKSLSSLVLHHSSSFASLVGLKRQCQSAPISRSNSPDAEELQQLLPESPEVSPSVLPGAESPAAGASSSGAVDAYVEDVAADQQPPAAPSCELVGKGETKRQLTASRSNRQLRWSDLPPEDEPAGSAGAAGSPAEKPWPAAGGMEEKPLQPQPQPQQQQQRQQQQQQGRHSYGGAFAQAVGTEMDYFEPWSRLYLDVVASPSAADSDDLVSESSDEVASASTRSTGSWWRSATAALHTSPSMTSLSAASAANSTSSSSSWRVLAYLPTMLTRSLSYSSLASWGSAAGAASIPLSRCESGEAPELGTAAAPTSSKGGTGFTVGGTSSKGGASSSRCSSLAGANSHSMVTRSKSSSALVPSPSSTPHLQQQQQQCLSVDSAVGVVLSLQGHRGSLLGNQVELHMRSSSALLRLLPSFGSLAAAAQQRVLTAALRVLLSASSSVLGLAKGLVDRALNVPLDVVEKGLIAVLRPPMYCSVGQQWVLTSTGLLPQEHPIEQYTQYPWDVFWHKELAMVAFRQHSINFYKHRLLKQASRR